MAGTDATADVAAVRRLLAPRSIAVIGASERSRWSGAVIDNLRRHGFGGTLHLVNPRGRDVAGQRTVTSCTRIEDGVDLGILLVPAAAVAGALADLGGTGAHSAVILTSGFAEVGGEGAALQESVAQVAAAAGIRLLGPNSLGFMSVAAATVPWAAPVEIPRCERGVALVSQSGATAYFLARHAVEQGVDVHSVVATGNEADLDCATVAHALLAEEGVTSVALFVESVRHPDRFVDAAVEARRRRKALIVLKVGASEVSARSALAHTGAVVGDDRAFDGVCARLGVVRVHSLDQLITCADVLGRTGPLAGGGLCVISNSGGVCEIAADTAAALGVDMATIPADCQEDLRSALPSYATPHNPLDFTGGVEPAGAEAVIRRLAELPQCGAVLVPFYPVPADGSPGDKRLQEMHEHMGRALREIDKPGFLVTYTSGTVTAAARRHIDNAGLPYLACGMDQALVALAKGWEWRARLERPLPAPGPALPRIEQRPGSELATLELLDRHGVATVPRVLAEDAAAAVRAAREWDQPVAVKVASAQISHKSEIGGVVLGARGDDAVAAAFEKVTAAGRTQPGATVDGAIVSPMRGGGVELFVGCSHDATWGPVMAVGLGGIWVEVLADVAVRPLPVTPAEVADMLRSLRGARLLGGERGVPPVDLDAVGAAVAAIGDVALALGPDLAALEVNPLWVRADQVEALDGLAIWAS